MSRLHGLPHPIGIQSVVNLAAFEKLLGQAAGLLTPVPFIRFDYAASSRLVSSIRRC